MTSVGGTDVIYHAIAHRTRREIIDFLRHGGLPATEIAAKFSISQPAVSQQLRVLLEAELVRAEVAGRRRIYQLNPERLRVVERWVARAVEAPSGHLLVFREAKRKGE
jgi:DNA-binding transcriptional ArsR family regulator